ncbi:MAG: hypothetical protein C0599_10890 [Salinivirgaceae bacterium]|nr:MAG: hypothetical protein C0599_10890 [Salinivirgaceae bacterium]
MLYLGSEIGDGDVNLQEIALNFTSLGDEHEVKNLSIKFIETSATELGTAYEDMTSATEVFSAATYTMPTETGWHTFDITDFVFNASSNLLVEIVWGDNGAWSSPSYVVQSTTTAFTSVVYGYSDSETPPAYDGNSSVRPNLMLYIEGEAPGTMYGANFTVTDGTNPIEGATVMIGSMEHSSDVNGQTSFDLYEGTYYYSVYADGYGSVVNEEMIVDEMEEMNITLGVGINSHVAQNLKIYPNPTNGNVTIELPNVVSGAQVAVLDLAGKTVITKGFESTNATLDLSNLSEGIYIVKVQNGNILHTNKIIVE